MKSRPRSTWGVRRHAIGLTHDHHFQFFLVIAVTAVIFGCGGCGPPANQASRDSANKVTRAAVSAESGKTGVLLVSHGSHSAQWRKMLFDVEHDVSDRVLATPGIDGIKSAFMEYTEPSIATQLKAFDDEGYTQVILIPLLLTVSSHSFDDIPTIIGAKADAKSLAMLEAEGIERYVPQADVKITPLLDFSALLETNLTRRVSRLTENASTEGVVLVAYGDAQYSDEWSAMLNNIGETLKADLGIATVTHAWCGHLVAYKTKPTVDAIQQVLDQYDRAIVVPVLVAYDEMFQGKIIGGAVKEISDKNRVDYRPDSILPEPALNDWIVSITKQTCKELDGAARQERQR